MKSQFLLSFLVICVTIGSSWSATLSKTNAAQRQQPFFATKTAQLIQPQQEEEAALPGFVEPPAAPVPEPDAGQPMMPYEFEYSAAATGGSSARRESNDGQRVTGTYTLAGPDGINRVVHYVADKDGFRATIVTNEPGTESQSPSGVILNSSQLPGDQIALQYGPREPAQPTGPVLLAPIPAIPAFAPAPLLPLAAPIQLSGALIATSAPADTTQTTSAPSSPSTPSQSARLLAAAGIKGAAAPIIQQRLSPVQARKTAAVKAAPIVQQRQEAIKAPVRPAAVKAAPIVQQRQEAVKAAPIVQQRQEAIKAPVRPAAVKAAPQIRRPPPPPPAPIKGKSLPPPRPARLQTKTAPIKSAQRQPFYATLPPPPPPPPAPTTIAQQLDQLVQQQQQEEQQEQQQAPQQELEQLRQEPQQQQQLDQQQDQDAASDQEAENPTENTFFEA